MDYGKRFKYCRNRVNLTQKEAAALIGIKDYQLGNYETNRSEPNLDILKKMSNVYKVSIDKMIGNNVLQNNLTEEDNEEPLDINELIDNLNELVGKINKANK